MDFLYWLVPHVPDPCLTSFCVIRGRTVQGCMHEVHEEHEAPQLPAEEVMHTQAELDVLCNQDLLKLLFEKLGRLALCSAGATCRQWRQTAASDEFWTSLDFTGLGISPWQMVPLLRRHPNVQVLNLRGIPAGATLLQHDLLMLTRLSQLVLGDDMNEVPNASLAELNPLLPSLRQLSFHHSNFVCEGVIASSSVEDVVLESCNARAVCFDCPSMTRLSLRLSNITSFTVQGCSSLRCLDLQGVRKLNSRQLLKGLLDLGKLTSLNMQDNPPDITDEFLRAAATRLSKLQELLLSSCAGITLSAVRGFPALTFLDLSNCAALLPATAVGALESFTRLEHLNMTGCTGMTSLALNLPFLRALSLQDCSALTQIDLRCPSLRDCDLGLGTDSKLKQVHVSSKSLRSICWQGFPALADIHLACSGLTMVDVSDCNELGDATFRCLSGGQPGYALNGGSPSLRQLSMERCEGLGCCELSNSSLQHLSLADCPNLHTLALLCPALLCLNLEECKLLSKVSLQQVSLTTLCLGTCPHLTSLAVSGAHLHTMDLKGCNALEVLKLECPRLATLDATFCTQLDSLALIRALKGAPCLDALVLSVCLGLDPILPSIFNALGHLSLLDLSYTGLEDLQSIAQCCPGLTSLNISSCRSLHPAALSILFPDLVEQQEYMPNGQGMESNCALPQLTSLNVSYCALPAGMVCRLLRYGYRFQDIAMNGCSGVTGEVWQHVHTAPSGPAAVVGASGAQYAPQHALQSLSLVGCKGMRACLLGLMPLSGWDSLVPGQTPGDWLAAGCHLSALQSLKLGLSGAQSVALALPELTALDMNNCTDIRNLELRCPSLLTAYFQACGWLTGASLTLALQGSLELHTLDIQHIAVAAEDVLCLRQRLPLLDSVLHTQQHS